MALPGALDAFTDRIERRSERAGGAPEHAPDALPGSRESYGRHWTPSLLLFTRMGVRSHYLTILPGLIVGGIGTGLAMGPTTVAVLSAVPVDEAGVGSGVINTFRQIGGARYSRPPASSS